MAKTDQYTAQQMIDALLAENGMATRAAKRLGCSHTTVYRYIDTYPTVAAAKELAHEQLGDQLELTLYDEALKERNTAVMIFLAKTKYKSRGYTERVENINLDLTPELQKQLNEVAKALGVSAGDLLEAYVQELARVNEPAENTAGS